MPEHRREFLTTTAALAGTTALAGTAWAAGEREPERPVRTPHTRFAVNLEMWWRNRPFLERIEQAARLGFPAIEFWPWRGKDINAIAAACRRHKIEVAQFTAWGFRPGLNDPRNHPQFLDEIRASCETARQLNCRMMCVVAGDDVAGMTQAQMHQHVIDGLRQAAPIAERAGVTLILEPMNIRVDHRGHCLYGSEPTLRIIRAVNSRFVKVLWDLYHLQITEGDLCGHLAEGLASIAYIQIADHPGRNEPGTGEINYTRVFKKLQELKYAGLVGLELRPLRDEVAAARAVYRADSW